MSISTHLMEQIVKDSFAEHPTKTVMRIDYFLRRLQKEGRKSVSIHHIRVVGNMYIKKKFYD